MKPYFEVEEGDRCPICNLSFLVYRIENCSCHINPPCSACIDSKLECPSCGFEEDDEIEFLIEFLDKNEFYI